MSESRTNIRLAAENLSGERGAERIFSGISFTLEGGMSLAVTGPNGAGKSTLLRIIAGLLPAAQGHIRLVADEARWPVPAAACHYLGHLNGMKATLTLHENLAFWRSFLGEPLMSPENALASVGLADIGHLPLSYLSAGQRRRAAIARLLVSFRPIWLLDEPTTGLDQASAFRFSELMRNHLDVGGIIVAATHLPLGLDASQELRMEARFA